MEDSLKIYYDEETRQITIDWDNNDPNWSFLNNMSEEEIQQILITSLEELVDEDESD
jgi:hypothetical protein|tara:strand:- start:1585 stop:1755 length:171 start_codon:yes stop_codon:yes gene_type:complete